MEDFRKFFKEYDMERLNNVKAFVMDMNASFNRLVEKYMPKTEIVRKLRVTYTDPLC